MGRDLAAFMLACAVWTALVTAVPATDVQAVNTVPVVGNGDGRYTDAAPVALTGALDRVTGELDASPWPPTPREVKDLTFRRRMIELRLLMDLHALAYDRDLIKSYREAVDNAYEAVGQYQDIAVVEKLLQVEVSQDLKDDLFNQMNGAVFIFRDQRIRGEMRSFLARPLRDVRTDRGLRTPGIWDVAGEVPTDNYDTIGNVAMLASGVLRSLQSRDLGVHDIFDMNQAIAYHTIRRQLRNVLLYSAMFPALNAATQDVVVPLDEFVDDYGEVNDAHTAFLYAQGIGADANAAGAELQREWEKSFEIKNLVVETHALDALAARLNQVRDAHRRR